MEESTQHSPPQQHRHTGTRTKLFFTRPRENKTNPIHPSKKQRKKRDGRRANERTGGRTSNLFSFLFVLLVGWYLNLLKGNFKGEGLIEVGVEGTFLYCCFLFLQPLVALVQSNFHVGIWRERKRTDIRLASASVHDFSRTLPGHSTTGMQWMIRKILAGEQKNGHMVNFHCCLSLLTCSEWCSGLWEGSKRTDTWLIFIAVRLCWHAVNDAQDSGMAAKECT